MEMTTSLTELNIPLSKHWSLSHMHAESGNTRDMVERKYPRFTIELPCLYSLDHSRNWSGIATNISLGGCSIRCSTPVQKGDYLKVVIFHSIDHDPIEIGLAPVRWATGDQFGVEFITLAPSDMKRLQTLLTALEH